MGTKNTPGPFDCYAAAHPDEPLFVLLGRDVQAPWLVRLWALRRHETGEDPAKVQEALACAEQMDAWLREHGKDPRDGRSEAMLIAATTGMGEHPEGYDHACACAQCLSYAEPG